MRVLVDSQSLIWYVDQDHFLSLAARAAISDPNNDIAVSAASTWEIGIKVAIGKLTLSLPFRAWMDKVLADLGAAILPVTLDYIERQVALPFHHRDPFDRIIVAQALVEGIPVVSTDAIFDAYGVRRI